MKRNVAKLLGLMVTLLILSMCVTIGTAVTVFASEGAYTYDTEITSSTTISAENGKSILVSGEGVVANITLNNVTINRSNDVSLSAIRVENGATVKLTIVGNNTLRGSEGVAGISVNATSTLIIEEASTGTLNVYGGLMAAGIGGDAGESNGTVVINGGTINAYGGDNAGQFADERGGAGIGGGNTGGGGSITINGGIIKADGGESSAGIGGGNNGATGTIVINNGTINCYAGYHGAAIGGVGGTIEINNGSIVADGYAYGAAIGCDAYGSGVAITINGGTIHAESSSFSSAIGGGISSISGAIVITGGTITADGEACGIGKASSIAISGGTITATADAGGTGIMSSNITISGGVINATGGSDGAGIGGSSSGTITISGGTITAKGGYNAAGVGGKSGGSGGNIVITGGSIKAIPGSKDAQAVGSGTNGSTTVITNGTENIKLVVVDKALNDSNTQLANLKVTVGDDKEYLYSGYGHNEDHLLYFYLPETYSLPSGLTEVEQALLDGYDVHIFESGNYTAENGKNIKVSGEDVVANILLDTVTINKSNEVSVSAIRIENGATVKLTILGSNTLRASSGIAGISIDETSTLIIEEASTGTLNVYGGLMAAGIGGDAGESNGTVVINGGTINAYGGDNAGQFADERGGAGIGGGNTGGGGSITINGGIIKADGGESSAGIGGGNNGATGTIVINNGTINCYAGYHGAAIGGVGGTIEINNGSIVADGYAYGAAIGCDAYGSGVAITINGGTIHAESSSFSSAIGGGISSISGAIVITGGTITADGEACGIGKASSIAISGGTITATADAGGTGIMSSNITISGGVINATGGSDGAGIGGSSSGTITISGGTITAKGGLDGAGIGGKSGTSGGTIIITGGSIKAIPGSKNAQAVGSGANATTASVTNGNNNGNQSLTLVTVDNIVSADNSKLANVVVDAGVLSNTYEYLYSGYGHANDSKLYFYLPETYTIHVWDEGVITKHPTCIETGTKTYTCSCGEIKTETLDTINEHSFNKQVVSDDYKATTATCEKAATYYYSCVCGLNGTQTFENGEKDPANHTKSTHVYEINDHDSSKHDKKHECCGAIIETTTHSGGTATCQVKATCDICKSAYGALGDHNYDGNSWGYKSTDGHAHNCQTAGCTAHDTVIGHTSSGAATEDVAETCTECGYIISPALGHKKHTAKTEWITDDKYHWHECAGCEGQQLDKSSHKDLDNNTKCDTCGATVPVGTVGEPDEDVNSDGDGLSGGAIAGIAVGSTAVVGIGGFSLIWFVIKKKSWADLLAIFKK